MQSNACAPMASCVDLLNPPLRKLRYYKPILGPNEGVMWQQLHQSKMNYIQSYVCTLMYTPATQLYVLQIQILIAVKADLAHSAAMPADTASPAKWDTLGSTLCRYRCALRNLSLLSCLRALPSRAPSDHASRYSFLCFPTQGPP